MYGYCLGPTDGYTPGTPTTVLGDTTAPHTGWDGPAQRLAVSVKTVISGYPTYRHALDPMLPSRAGSHVTVTLRIPYIRFINNAHLYRLSLRLTALNVCLRLTALNVCLRLTALKIPDGKSAVHHGILFVAVYSRVGWTMGDWIHVSGHAGSATFRIFLVKRPYRHLAYP